MITCVLYPPGSLSVPHTAHPAPLVLELLSSEIHITHAPCPLPSCWVGSWKTGAPAPRRPPDCGLWWAAALSHGSGKAAFPPGPSKTAACCHPCRPGVVGKQQTGSARSWLDHRSLTHASGQFLHETQRENCFLPGPQGGGKPALSHYRACLSHLSNCSAEHLGRGLKTKTERTSLSRDQKRLS